MDIIKLISESRSGVVQILVEREREWIGFGSGFLVNEGIVTCSHNIRGRRIDAVAVRFEDTDPEDPAAYIRFDPGDHVVAESLETERDFVYLRYWEEEFDGRHTFNFTDHSALSAGEQILFLGFPFGTPYLTSHLGYVSSIHERRGTFVIQIDGSVNGGNSGGPLVDIKTGLVAGIVTRATTGISEKQFNQLIESLQANQEALAMMQGGMVMSRGDVKVDPMNALRVSQAAIEQIAKDLKRSANVGIGHAFSSEYVRDEIARFE